MGKNHIITEAGNGEEAVNLARNGKPDLVLMDVMMPALDGYNACWLIKREPCTAKIPLVMPMGLHYNLNVRLAEKVGAIGYITKPLNSQGLLEKINQFFCNGR